MTTLVTPCPECEWVGNATTLGFLTWLLTTRVPMPPGWATAIQVIVLVLVILYVLTRVVHIPNVL